MTKYTRFADVPPDAFERACTRLMEITGETDRDFVMRVMRIAAIAKDAIIRELDRQ